MKIIFVLILFLVAKIAKAQTDDYVITTHGDTIRCYVYISSTRSAKYQLREGKKQKITINEIKEYYQTPTDLRFRAIYRDSSNKSEFLRVIENGTISLYLHPGNNYNYSVGLILTITAMPTSWLIAKENNKAVTLKITSVFNNNTRQQGKDTLAIMLSDKPLLLQKYKEDGKFDYLHILNLVHLYNTGQPYKAPVKKPDPMAKKDDIY